MCCTPEKSSFVANSCDISVAKLILAEPYIDIVSGVVDSLLFESGFGRVPAREERCREIPGKTKSALVLGPATVPLDLD